MGTRSPRNTGRKRTADRPADASLPGRPVCAAFGDTSAYADDEREFLAAIERYKRERKRPFPTWTEALNVLKALGYRKAPSETR